MSIAYILPLYWIFVSIVGLFIYSFTDRADYSFYGLYANDSFYVMSIAAHFVAAISFVIGLLGTDKLIFSKFYVRDLALSRKQSITFMAVVASVLFVFAILANLITYGWSDLFVRYYYLPEDGGAWAVVARLASVFGIILSCAIIINGVNFIYIMGVFSGLFHVLMFASKGSRFAVAAFLMLLMAIIFGKAKKIKLYHVVVMMVLFFLSVPLLHSVIALRKYGYFGVYALFETMPESFASFYDDNFRALWLVIANISFSVPVTQVTIENTYSLKENFKYILIALNPLPGNFVGWSDVGGGRRISADIPYSALGELAGFSYISLSIYFLLSGSIFGGAFIMGRNFSDFIRTSFYFLMTALCVLFGLLCIQYNLRDTTRILYYAILVGALFLFLDKKIKAKRV